MLALVAELGIEFDLVISHLEESYRTVDIAQLPNAYHVVHNSYTGQMRLVKRRIGLQAHHLRRLFRSYADKDLVTVSQGVQSELTALPQDYKSIRTIYNPFDLDGIRHLANNHNEDVLQAPYIVAVGRTARQKRLDVLLRAYHASGIEHKLLLLTHKPKKLMPLVKKLGLEDRVIFKAFTQNPYAHMKHADLLVLSSDFEGFGNVLVEALAVGTQVVSTRCPHGPDEILTGDLQSQLCDLGDEAGLAEKIRTSLAQPVDVSAVDLSRFELQASVDQYIALMD